MGHGSRLMAHASRLATQGSWLMAKNKLALGLGPSGPSANFFSVMSHQPWATTLEAWTMSRSCWLSLRRSISKRSRTNAKPVSKILIVGNLRILNIGFVGKYVCRKILEIRPITSWQYWICTQVAFNIFNQHEMYILYFAIQLQAHKQMSYIF